MPTAIAAAVAFAAPAGAQDLVVGLGATRIDDPRDTSHAIAVSYSHELDAHLSASFSYLNEGHFPGHHRDGHSLQLWLRAAPFSPNVVLAAGVGPYRYFDTTVAENTDARQFENAHGWGMQYSLAARWVSSTTPWMYEVRANRNQLRGVNRNATQIVAAVGYRLEQDGGSGGDATTGRSAGGGDEFVVYAGRTIANSFRSESTNASAASIDYRHAFGPALRGLVGFLHEGDAEVLRRNGVVAELLLEPSFYRNCFTLGLGVGAYYARDEYADDSTRLMPLVTTTASLQLGRDWLARITWHRIVSNYNRDSDIVLLGVGYRF